MIEAKGYNGQVRFDGEYVTITRKGFLARMTIGKGEKRIHISQITAVQWKPPGAMVNGYIQFTVPGGIEKRSTFGKQTASAGRDENSVIVTKMEAPAFEELRAAIDDAIARQHGPLASSMGSLADELAKLQQLLVTGALTQDEYAAAKARLLGHDGQLSPGWGAHPDRAQPERNVQPDCRRPPPDTNPTDTNRADGGE